MRIRQYFAPDKQIEPDREGWTAIERSARAEDELFREAARNTEEVGHLQAQEIGDLKWPFDIYRLESETNNKPGRFSFEGNREYDGSRANAHNQISRGAGTLGSILPYFGRSYTPQEPSIWSSASGTPQPGEEDIDAATGLPIDMRAWVKAYNKQASLDFDQYTGTYRNPVDTYGEVKREQEDIYQQNAANYKQSTQAQTMTYEQARQASWWNAQVLNGTVPPGYTPPPLPPQQPIPQQQAAGTGYSDPSLDPDTGLEKSSQPGFVGSAIAALGAMFPPTPTPQGNAGPAPDTGGSY